MAIDTPVLSEAVTGFLGDYTVGAEARSAIEKLFDELESHEREEADILKEYERAAVEGRDAGYRYLMGLVLEDERRHHRLSSAMAKEIRQSLLWLDEEPALPGITASGEVREQLLRKTNRFLEIEHAGERQLDAMKDQVKALHGGLLELIVDVMRADTRKHVQILKYIKKRLEEPSQ